MTEQDVWQQTLNLLQPQMTQGTFNTWLKDSLLISVQESLLQDTGVYTIEIVSSEGVDWLEHRLKGVIVRTLTEVVGHPVTVKFVAREQTPYIPVDTFTEESEPEEDEADAEFSGVYRNKELALIQPDKVEVHTQYFRKKWRPLLGPTLSELIRELRQRCYFKGGRNSFKTTYKSLAKAVGVNERTILRALERDKAGNFKNKYLGYFIKDIKVLKESDGKGGIRSLGTQFIIYLDEPLTPEDQSKLS